MRVTLNIGYERWLVDLTGHELEVYMSICNRARKVEDIAYKGNTLVMTVDPEARMKEVPEFVASSTAVREVEPPAEVQP